MLIKQLSVFVENKLGRMAEITRIIADAQIDIRALSVADTSDFGILRLIVNKPDLAAKMLHDAGLAVSLTDVIAVGIDDAPGSFAGIVGLLSDAGVNLEYMYAFLSREQNRAFVILRVEDAPRAVRLLEEADVYMLADREIYDM